MFSHQAERNGGGSDRKGQICVMGDRKKKTKYAKTWVLGDALARREKRRKKEDTGKST